MVTKAPTPKSPTAKTAPKPYKSLQAHTTDNASAGTDEAAPDNKGNFIRRKEFVDRVVATSGLKPNVVKTTLDAVLQEIGDALSKGEALNLPPLGKLSVNRQKDIKGGEVLICKLRRSTPALKIQPPLAETQDVG